MHKPNDDIFVKFPELPSRYMNIGDVADIKLGVFQRDKKGRGKKISETTIPDLLSKLL